jgi:hypothetical protein
MGIRKKRVFVHLFAVSEVFKMYGWKVQASSIQARLWSGEGV